MNDEQKIEHGERALALLDSQPFLDCVARLRELYIEAWVAAKTVDAREDAHRFVLLIEWLKNDLKSVAQTGTLTRQRLNVVQGESIWKRALNG